MAITFRDMQRFVYDRLGVATPTYPIELRTKSLLVTEHRRLCAEHDLTLTSGTLATVADNPLVTLPADFMKLKQIIRGQYRVFPVGADEFAERAALEAAAGSADTGNNSLYAMFEGPLRLRITPTPTLTSATAMTLWYCYRPVAMSADSDLPDGIYDEWADVLIESVVLRMSRIAGRPELVEDAKEARNELLERLGTAMADRQNATGRIPLPGYGIR